MFKYYYYYTSHVSDSIVSVASHVPDSIVPVATFDGKIVKYTFIHPTLTCFSCLIPRCDLSYPKHASFVRHMGVSHKGVGLEINFSCSLCPYVHANLRSVSLHFRHAHGTAPPPITVDGSKEKACPLCKLTLPSKVSCSTYIKPNRLLATSSCTNKTA